MYRIVRSDRKTLSLTLTREGETLVRAPVSLSEAEIDAFVRRHSDWLEKKRAQRKEAPKLLLRDGDEVVLFGTRFRIAFAVRARLSEERGLLYLPQTERREAFVRCLKILSEARMCAVTGRLAAKFGLSFREVRISSARSRWGSCNAQGTIAYTFRIALLEPALCEYVAAHELAHTRHMDHSRLFWREVERMLPDYRWRRAELKKRVGIMNCI